MKKGLKGELNHLKRARDLFEKYTADPDKPITVQTWLRYFKVLQFFGDDRKASHIIQRILRTADEYNSDYPNYLLYAGAVFKAMGDHEKANEYFFRLLDSGPQLELPKGFTKLEIMTIIGRNLEELHSATTLQGEEHREWSGDGDEAYKMVREYNVDGL